MELRIEIGVQQNPRESEGRNDLPTAVETLELWICGWKEKEATEGAIGYLFFFPSKPRLRGFIFFPQKYYASFLFGAEMILTADAAFQNLGEVYFQL